MPLEEPSWWYGAGGSTAAKLLKPLGALYGLVAAARFKAATPYRSPLPIICIGNFTAGGTGKTPAAITIAGLASSLGERPAFLSRGYGGKIPGPHWVNPLTDMASDVGDEPLLLAAHAPTLIARDRRLGAMAIAAAGSGPTEHGAPAPTQVSATASAPASAPGPALAPTAIIMDDGLQNPALFKDLSFAIVDGTRGLGNGEVIPAGPLRAPLAFQLPLADAIIFNAQDLSGPAGVAQAEDMAFMQHRLFEGALFDGPVFTGKTKPAGDTAWLAGKPVLAFAGIGAPERFFSMLERLGARLIARRAFKDHHDYSQNDAEALLGEAEAAGAQLVTTQKDHARLSAGPPNLQALKSRARVLPIAFYLEPEAERQLIALLVAVLRQQRARGDAAAGSQGLLRS